MAGLPGFCSDMSGEYRGCLSNLLVHAWAFINANGKYSFLIVGYHQPPAEPCEEIQRILIISALTAKGKDIIQMKRKLQAAGI